jgi:hypothetical protein
MLLSPEQTFVGRDIHVWRGASKSLSYPLTSDFLPRTWSDLETSGRRKWPGVVAIADLAGMFSKQAADKLGKVFENLFRNGDNYGDDVRIDKAY